MFLGTVYTLRNYISSFISVSIGELQYMCSVVTFCGILVEYVCLCYGFVLVESVYHLCCLVVPFGWAYFVFV